MSTNAETLLVAEDAVHDLVETLTRLKKEVENYGQAGRALDGVRGDLHDFIRRTTDLAEASHATIAVLGRIGTPELLSRLDAMRTRGESSHTAVDDALAECRQIGLAQREHAGKLDSLTEKVDQELARIEGQVADRVAEAISHVDRPLAALAWRQTFAIVLIALAFLANLAAIGQSFPAIRAAVGLR